MLLLLTALLFTADDAAPVKADERYLKAHGLSAREVHGVVPISAFFWVGAR